jgi:nucleoside-specific outer membrane channel protein Tsx
MRAILTSLFLITFTHNLFAFSTTDIEYLYGDFNGNSGFDTVGGKSTITLENFSTYEYGDFFGFADFAIANDRFKYDDKSTDLYFELSPRLSLSKTTGKELSFLFVKDIFIAGQYNRQVHKFEDYYAWLYGVGADLSVKGFDVFGLNFYKKNPNFGKETYQLSANYLSQDIFNTAFTIDGFADWTREDFLSQNRLLYKLDYSPLSTNIYIGSEWHYYKVKNSDVESNVLQAMMMLKW